MRNSASPLKSISNSTENPEKYDILRAFLKSYYQSFTNPDAHYPKTCSYKKIIVNAATNGSVSLTFKSKSVLWSYGDPMELEEFNYKLHAEHWQSMATHLCAVRFLLLCLKAVKIFACKL